MTEDSVREAGRERAVAFVVARLDSERLFAKQLREIGGRTMLDWIVDRLEESDEVDEIVVTTIDEPESDRLWDFAKQRGLDCYCYAGDVDDVTSRLRQAAEASDAEICLLVSADCPLIDPAGIDFLVRQLRDDPEADIVGPERRADQANLLAGLSAARLRCWQLADDLSYTPELRQHQFPVIRQKEHLFAVRIVPLPERYYGPNLRLSVDTWADLEFMNALHARLGDDFRLLPAVELLAREPELLELNAHVHQRGGDEEARRVLFVADAGEGFGYGHLMRCRELALQVVERHGARVEFLVDDTAAIEMLAERGLRASWGAVGRPAAPAPEGVTTELAANLAHGHDLVVLDLQAGRDLEPGWRARFGSRVAVLDRTSPWTDEADLAVLPTAVLPDDFATPATVPGGTTPVVGGVDYLILRRGVRRARALPLAERDIDVLAYLHDAGERRALEVFAETHGLRAQVLTGPVDDFAERLARTKVFVSGFGVAFYEALVLGAYPVAWPLSDDHARDALRFYEVFDLDPVVLDGASGLGLLEAVVATRPENLPVPTDGTARIVEEFFELLDEDAASSDEHEGSVDGTAVA